MQQKASSEHSSLKLRVVFAGTPDFARLTLESLVEHGHNIVGVYCQPDSQKGRGRILTMCPVKESAIAHNLDVYQPQTLVDHNSQSLFSELEADVMVVCAYGQILPKEILNSPKYGCLNIHASLLPRWRGAAPIQRAILAGDTETGIGIMQMNEGLDTGDLLLEKRCPISDTDTSQILHDKLVILGSQAIIEVLQDLDNTKPITQSIEGVLYANKLAKSESWIDWNNDATEICRKIRSFNPYPIAQTHASSDKFDSKVLRIISASVVDISHRNKPGEVIKCEKSVCHVATGSGAVNIDTVQLSGKNVVSIKDFNNAYKLTLLS
mgnify:CR=1 FL=1|jgi:methionyl-tRNA formyltransferase|tara:strand:- start:85 stop:1053 length:969 start_codon:yes stop_codon:yes gene_type:complete